MPRPKSSFWTLRDASRATDVVHSIVIPSVLFDNRKLQSRDPLSDCLRDSADR